ncbi:MAG: undecaprenyl-diphosphate phosphatase [Zhongshania sp.]|uniref:undecaprenyl-diphosphate phosphatase n=1 Tax=Zhongshania sp. TaxID=1971902 RepID=UPI0026171148|nr:undecaprenyl-diphosphate phosphatase [Zhongshania sp.]MDF1690994.1 undecaprenyl-diphosphate phosphatase [Zhongshania sp.]
MDAFRAVILAAIQGLTEFLPISSSGHLVLPQTLFGWEDQGLAFDVSVHVGSLLAVLWYFRVEVRGILGDWFGSLVGGQQNENSRLGWMVIVATIPAVVAGLIFNDFIELNLRTGYVLATTTLVFGVILGVVDRYAKHSRHLADIGLRIALIVGFAQAIALIPGTSRSGITITAALMMGLSRSDSARFSFLLSMPIIAAAGSYKLLELVQGSAEVPWGYLFIGFVVSAITAYACIHVFMRWVERMGMMPFAIYRVILAAILFAVLAN